MSTDHPYRVQFSQDAKDDLQDLDGSVRKKVLSAVKKLQADPYGYGRPLGSRPRGRLAGFYKHVVGNREIRIIYEILPDNSVVVLWVIGKRSDDECYELAYSRVEQIGTEEHRSQIESLLKSAYKK